MNEIQRFAVIPIPHGYSLQAVRAEMICHADENNASIAYPVLITGAVETGRLSSPRLLTDNEWSGYLSLTKDRLRLEVEACEPHVRCIPDR